MAEARSHAPTRGPVLANTSRCSWHHLFTTGGLEDRHALPWPRSTVDCVCALHGCICIRYRSRGCRSHSCRLRAVNAPGIVSAEPCCMQPTPSQATATQLSSTLRITNKTQSSNSWPVCASSHHPIFCMLYSEALRVASAGHMVPGVFADPPVAPALSLGIALCIYVDV